MFGMPLLMFASHNPSLESMTAAWLLPFIPAVVRPGLPASCTHEEQHALLIICATAACLACQRPPVDITHCRCAPGLGAGWQASCPQKTH